MIDALEKLYPIVEGQPRSIEEREDGWYVNDLKVEITQTLQDLQDVEAKKRRERAWRDSELRKSDILALQASLGEYGKNVQSIKVYRQALREFPNHQDFPNNQRPILSDY